MTKAFKKLNDIISAKFLINMIYQLLMTVLKYSTMPRKIVLVICCNMTAESKDYARKLNTETKKEAIY